MSNIIAISNYRTCNTEHDTKIQRTKTAHIEQLFGSLSRTLRRLKRDMLSEKCPEDQRWLRSVRPFRQRFCFLVRKFSGLSLEELCSKLNEHPDILKLHRYPSYPHFYPFTVQFLTDLETDISNIFEYCPSGLAFGGIGTPTDEVERAIADICGVTKEHSEYIQWCLEYRFGKNTIW